MPINTLKPSIKINEKIRNFHADIVKTMHHDSIDGEKVTLDEIQAVFSNVEKESVLFPIEKKALAEEAYTMTANRRSPEASVYLQNFVNQESRKVGIIDGISTQLAAAENETSINGSVVTHDEINDIFSVVGRNQELSSNDKANLARFANEMLGIDGFGARAYLQNFSRNEILQAKIKTGEHTLNNVQDKVAVQFGNIDMLSSRLSSVSSEVLTLGGHTSGAGHGRYEEHLISTEQLQDVSGFTSFINDNLKTIVSEVNIQLEASYSNVNISSHDLNDIMMYCDQAFLQAEKLKKRISYVATAPALVNKVEISDDIDQILLQMEKAKEAVLYFISK